MLDLKLQSMGDDGKMLDGRARDGRTPLNSPLSWNFLCTIFEVST
jgi:hypothetical protein